MLIDCDSCAVRGLHCADCVVSTFLSLPRARPAGLPTRAGPAPVSPALPASGGVELDAGQAEALATQMAAGLVPPLRLVAMSAPPDPERGIA